MSDITEIDAATLQMAVKKGILKPEDYPGRNNQAFRLLIRSLRRRS